MLTLIQSVSKKKFQERSREITLQEEGGARKAPWNLAKHIFKLKHADKATFYSPIEARTTPAPPSKLQEEKRIRDRFRNLNAHAEPKGFELRRNGEVQTNEEAQVYVHDLGLFRDCGNTRGQACSVIAWKALRRTQIFM